MPFLLLDDATQEAQRRLQEYGNGLLTNLQQANQPPLQNASVEDVTSRLQDFGAQQLQQLQQLNQPPFPGALGTTPGAPPPVPGVTLPTPPQQIQQLNQPPLQQLQPEGLQDITQRLQDFGTQQLSNAQQQVQQLNQPPFAGVQPPLEPFAQPTGGDLQDYARQAANRAGIDPDIFLRQIQQESGFNPGARSPAGAIGIAQFMPDTARGLGIDPTDPYASLTGAAQLMASNLQRYGGDYAKALAAYNAGPGNVDKYGGVPPFEETQRYVSTILGGAKQAAQQSVSAVQQAGQNVLGQISQFGDKQLSAAEAYAACGPAAAVRFAQIFGRQPTLREAVDLASQVGWTPQGGMAGLGSESALFDKMGIPHREVGANWDALAREASSGNPVTISTPGHYFTADAYDSNSGAFHVGSSGTDLRGGSEWMTPAQMEARMGQLQGGLAVDNPQVPAASPLANPTQAIAQGAQDVTQKAQQAWTLLQQAPEAARGFISPLASAFESARQNMDLSDPATQEFMRQHPEEMKYLGIGQPEQELSVTDPHLISALGIDPLGALQRGGADILGGVQTGDVGRALGGAFEAGTGGLLSALPGAGELGQGPGIVAEALGSPAVQTALRSRLPAEATSGFASGADAIQAARQALTSGTGTVADLATALSQYPEEVKAVLRTFVEEQTQAGMSGKQINDTLRQWVSDNPVESLTRPTGPVPELDAAVNRAGPAALEAGPPSRYDPATGQWTGEPLAEPPATANLPKGVTPELVDMAHQRIDRAIDVGSPRNYDAHEALDNLLARNADPGQIARFFANLTGEGTTAMSVLRSLRTGAMAGGLSTEAKVAASPFIQSALRAPAGAVNLLLQGRAGDILAGFSGGMAGLVEGARDALQTVRYGINYRAALGGGAQGGYGFAPGLDVLGSNPLKRAVGTGLIGLVRTHGAISDISAGIGRGANLALGASPEAAAEAGQQWALRSGEYGTIGSAVNNAMNALRGKNPALDVASQILLPFYRVGYNVFTQGVERSPLGLGGRVIDAVQGRPLDRAKLVNNLFGVGLAGLAFSEAAQGNITGERPERGDPKQSIRVAGQWLPLRAFGPASEPLAQAAALYESARDNEGDTTGLATQLASEYVKHVADETWLSSLADAMNTIGAVGNTSSATAQVRGAAQRELGYQAAQYGKSFIPQERLGEQVLGALGFTAPATTATGTYAPARGAARSGGATVHRAR